MIFSNSPVKTVQEKVNPFSKKNKLSSLKFERKKDYKIFIKFIKDNTKELEQIKIDDKEKKLKRGLATGGIVGGALLLSLFAGDDDSGMREQANKINNFNLVAEKAKADAKKDLKESQESGEIGKKSMLATIGLNLKKVGLFARNKAKRFIKTRQRIKNTARIKKNIRVREEVFDRINKKTKKFSINRSKVTVTSDSGRRGSGKSNVTYAGSDEDAKIGFPSEEDLKQERKITKKIQKQKEKDILKNFFNKQKNQKNVQQETLDKFNRSVKEAENINRRVIKFNEGKLKSDQNKLKYIFRTPDASRQFFDPFRINPTEPFMDDDVGNPFRPQDRDPSTSKIKAPEIPKTKRKKTSRFTRGLDKLTNFSDKIVNSRFARGLERVYRITTGEEFVEGAIKLIARNPKLFTTLGKKGAKSIPAVDVLLDLVFPKPLGPNDEEERRLIEISKKIQSNNIERNASQNPTTNNVTPPTDFSTPNSNIFIDPKQQLNIDDLFFLKSFTGG